jgi:hypothetical protein
VWNDARAASKEVLEDVNRSMAICTIFSVGGGEVDIFFFLEDFGCCLDGIWREH